MPLINDLLSFSKLLASESTSAETVLGYLRIGFDLLAIVSITGAILFGFMGGVILGLFGSAFGVFCLILGVAAESDEKRFSLAMQEIKSRLEALERNNASGQQS